MLSLQAANDRAEKAGAMNTAKYTYWTCVGSVRGCCGVKHRTLEAAEKHCDQDAAAIRRAYPSTFPTRAYSDRRPEQKGQVEA